MREAIVLAGGKGTRLSSVVSDVPKPMAPVAGRPFLEHVLDRLVKFKFNRVILSVGYKSEKITEYFGVEYLGMPITYVIEDSPLGTGGAIKKSLDEINSESALVLNGDTYSELNYDEMLELNSQYKSVVVGGVEVPDVSRYGALEVACGNLINFIEKGVAGPGIINAGCYAVNKNELSSIVTQASFSFEEGYLQKVVKHRGIKVCVSKGKFIDIGIPNDYFYAQSYLNDR